MADRVRFPRMDMCAGTVKTLGIHMDRREVYLPGAPDGLRALFASDFHLRKRMDPRMYVDAMRAEKADLILLGGDFADERGQALRLFEAFRALSAPEGVFACVGNNDREAFGTDAELARALGVFGGRLLCGGAARLGCGVALAGVDEMRYGHPRFEGLFRADDACRILLSHFPCLPALAAPERPHLILSGHTHGGQFNLFGLTPYAVGFEHAYTKAVLPHAAVSGVLTRNGMTLLVSKGLGASRIPLRIGVRPEMHVLTLRRKA